MKFLKRRKKTGKKDRRIEEMEKMLFFILQMLLAIFYILKDIFVWQNQTLSLENKH